ncbi:MAG: RNA-guided endonuclease IscB [Candidatus Thorarchaeota archaeon]
MKENMQKLVGRDTCTPMDVSLVRSSVAMSLNREETLGEHGLKTLSNNSEENRSQHGGSSDLRVQNIVYVLNMRGKPLMPTSQQKANKLLRNNKAKVVKRKPFTIQLKYASGEAKQSITLGVDSGYKSVGFSAVSDKQELVSGELTLRSNIPKLMEQKKMYRRNRRSKLWHRPPRFLNRSKPKGWLAPSIQHKLDAHVRLVRQVESILPVSRVVVEVASFDIQKIKNPDIVGKEYQEGEQLGFWNVRAYVLHRDEYTCQHCRGKKKDKILQVHHINGRSEGATDRPEELLTVCVTCHNEHHKGIDIIPKKKVKQFKAETFMSLVRWKLTEVLGCEHTFGYITKHNIIKQSIEKSHVNDAFVIASGTGELGRCVPLVVKQVRRNNRCLQLNRKGYKPSIRRVRYKLQPFDLICCNGEKHHVKGVHNYGSRVMLANKKSFAISKVELINYGKGMCYV